MLKIKILVGFTAGITERKGKRNIGWKEMETDKGELIPLCSLQSYGLEIQY